MSLQEKLRGIRYLRWVKTTDDSFSFKPQQIYPLIRVEGENDLVVVDETQEEIYVEPEDHQYLIPVTDEEYRNSNRKTLNQVQQPNIHVAASPNILIQPTNNLPSVVDLNLDQFPHWAQYVTINNEGIWATSDAVDEVSKMKEKVVLETPIVLRIPKRKIPMETLAMWFKEGKISYEEFEEEMKNMFGGLR